MSAATTGSNSGEDATAAQTTAADATAAQTTADATAAHATAADRFKLGAVIITMGNRPAELAALIDSVLAQEGPAVELAVVSQGVPMPPVPAGVRTVELPENLGIPGGRNVGIELFGPNGRDVDAVLFLDDDGSLPRTDSARLLREAFTADPELGIVSFRIADPQTGQTQRRHVPRLRASDPLKSSRVTTFLGGASAVRSTVFEQAGQLPAEFFYAHEETDLAWRALDAGWSIDYRADIVLHHPTTSPARHAAYFHNVARNRVWLARRNLPAPLVPLYLCTWILLTLVRRPSGRHGRHGGKGSGRAGAHLRVSGGPCDGVLYGD